MSKPAFWRVDWNGNSSNYGPDEAMARDWVRLMAEAGHTPRLFRGEPAILPVPLNCEYEDVPVEHWEEVRA